MPIAKQMKHSPFKFITTTLTHRALLWHPALSWQQRQCFCVVINAAQPNTLPDALRFSELIAFAVLKLDVLGRDFT